MEVFMEVYTVEEFYCYDPKVCPPLPKVPDYLKQKGVEV